MARDPNTPPTPTRQRARDRLVRPRREPQHHALSRLWLMFIRTRVVIAAVVLGGARITGGSGTVIGTILGVILFMRGRHDRNRAAAYAALSSEG